MHMTRCTRLSQCSLWAVGRGPRCDSLWFLFPCCWTRVQKPFHSPQCLKMERAVGSEEGAKAAGLARGPGGPSTCGLSRGVAWSRQSPAGGALPTQGSPQPLPTAYLLATQFRLNAFSIKP